MSHAVDPGLAAARFSFRRVGAMVLRHLYLLRSSWPRTVEIIYWPIMQVSTWGFLQLYVNQHSTFFAQAVGILVGALLMWDILSRSQIGFSITFLEEMWSRNMGNLLMSPLKPSEYIVSLMVMSSIRLFIGLIPATLIAIPLFGFNIWSLGFGLGLFFAALMLTGWALGLVIAGLILRHGLGAEGLAWSLIFLMLPLCCVYYPVAQLPALVQPIAWMLAPTYVFEGLRALLIEQRLRLDLMAWAFALDLVYFSVAALVFSRLLAAARASGSLVQLGE
ncbi:MAG: ABC transporter permease [Hyphomicrobiaceae bacterium]|nr:ABC transporter permease [Hyphomicrobiaceae bacterium]